MIGTPSLRSRGRLAHEVYQRLADEIVLGRFEPGSRLDEVMLAERFAVSRTPVREALKQLATTGLVVTRPNRGSVVADLGPEQLDGLFEAIGEMEAACARHAALRMTESERGQLQALHAQARQAVQAADLDHYDAVNSQWHMLLVRGAHNPVLADSVTALHQRAAPFRRTQFRDVERMGESFAEHTVILQAVLARDALAAHREMRSHLLSARGATARLVQAAAGATA